MADEISQAIQIIRLEFDGLRFGMNVTGTTAKQVKNLTIFLYALLTREKLQGRTSLKKMISKDGNLQVLKIKETDYKKFSKVAKKYGLLYSKLPDINKDDGMMEILFHTEATPRINALIEKLGSGSIEDLVDYVKNGKDGDFEKIIDYLQQNNVLRSDKSITPSEEKKSQINSISRNLDYNAKLKDDCLVYVTVAKTSDNASGVLACLRKSDGSKAWEDSSSYAWSSPVCVYNKDGSGKVLYCNSTGDIRLLDGKTGKQEDVLSVSDGVIEASPAVYDNYAVVGTRDCKIWGIRLQ